MNIIWISIAILCILAELLNKKCAYIWFSISSIISLILFNLIHSFLISFCVFVFLGFILLVIFREYTLSKINNYNQNRIINKKGIVIKNIDNNHFGKVKIGRKIYKAKSQKNIKKDKKVKVIKYNNKIVEVEIIK